MARKSLANDKLEAERKRKDAERKRLKRLEIKNDPEKRAKEKEKEKQRYERRKEEGKLKSIKQMSRRDQKAQRKKWVTARRKYVAKQKMAEETDKFLIDNSPPESPQNEQRAPTPDQPSTSKSSEKASHQNTSGQKRRQKNNMRKHNALLKERNLRIKETQLKEKYKKKYYRLKQEKGGNPSPSPNKIVQHTMTQGKKEVRKKLLFLEVLKKQVKQNKKDFTERDRNVLAKSISGNTIRKYKKVLEMKCLVSKYLQMKVSKFSKEKNPMILRRKLKSSLYTRLRNTVTAFFENDENTVPSPEKSASITKKGVTKPKRYLTDSMINLHKKFEKESNVKLSYTTFLRMKPFWIYERRIKDRDTCRCIKHSNFELMIQKLHILGLTKSKSVYSFIEKMCCKTENQDCSNRTCKKCKDTPLLDKDIPEDFANSLTFYYQWKLTVQNYTNKNNQICSMKITSKNKKYCTVDDLLKRVQTAIPAFFEHAFRAYHQITTIREIKNALKQNEVSLYCDFSENYILKYTQEVQAVHFGGSQQQLSLHTGAFYYNDKGEIKHQSFSSLSKNTRHDPVAIWAHLTPILRLIRDTVPNSDTIYFNSDGPTSQYRNRTNIFMLTKIPAEYQFKSVIWNFFEAGHGKSVADAIGSVVKNNADKIVCRGSDVESIDTLVEQLRIGNIKTRLYVIEDRDIQNMQMKVPKVMRPVPQCMKIHQIVYCHEKRKMILRKISCTSCCSSQLDTCEKCQLEGVPAIHLERNMKTRAYYVENVTQKRPGNTLPNKINEIRFANAKKAKKELLDNAQNYVEDKAQDYEEDKAQDYVEDKAQNYVEDKAHDHVEDTAQDHVENKAQDHVEDKAQDHVEDKAQDHVEDKAQNHVEDKAHDHVEDKAQDLSDDDTLYQVDDIWSCLKSSKY